MLSFPNIQKSFFISNNQASNQQPVACPEADYICVQKTIVVGHSASGPEILTRIGRTAKQHVLVSVRRLPEHSAPDSRGKKFVPEIVEYLPEARSVRFADIVVEADVDKIYSIAQDIVVPSHSWTPYHHCIMTTALRTSISTCSTFLTPAKSSWLCHWSQSRLPWPKIKLLSGRSNLPSHDSMVQRDADIHTRHVSKQKTAQEAANFNVRKWRLYITGLDKPRAAIVSKMMAKANSPVIGMRATSGYEVYLVQSRQFSMLRAWRDTQSRHQKN